MRNDKPREIGWFVTVAVSVGRRSGSGGESVQPYTHSKSAEGKGAEQSVVSDQVELSSEGPAGD